jgi:16S rRNA processing protein RimM
MLLVGIVRRPHGREGEVSVEPLTSFPDRFVPGLTLLWRKDAQERRLTVAGVRPHGGRFLLAFDGVAGMDEARALSGGELSVPDEAAVKPPEGFYFGHEVAGWRCEDTGGRLLGTAAGLEQTTAGPLLSVDAPEKKGVLVPFVEGIVIRIDRAGRRIVLDAPQGLFDL